MTKKNRIQKLQRRIDKFAQKYKDKKVFLYGAGQFFQELSKELDLSKLNIVGISDLKFCNHKENETFLGYKVYSLSEVVDMKPDLLLVTLKFYTKVIEELYYRHFYNTKTKIRPFEQKGFIELFKEYSGIGKTK